MPTKLLSGAGMDVDSLDGSVIFDTLGARTNSIRLYQLYAKVDGTAVAGIASLGSGLDGHPGIVHGGVTALLFDNTFGWANAIGLLKERSALAAALHGPAKPAPHLEGTTYASLPLTLLVRHVGAHAQGQQLTAGSGGPAGAAGVEHQPIWFHGLPPHQLPRARPCRCAC